MAKNQRQRFSAGDIKVFVKSGNEVQLVEPSGNREWVVERTKGASKGKRMICRESALADKQ